MIHNNHEMKMPTNYTDMNQTELEYEGSFSWGKFFSGVALAGIIIAAGGIGLTAFLVSAEISATAGIGMIAAGGIMAVGGGILSMTSKSLPGDEFSDESNRFHVT